MKIIVKKSGCTDLVCKVEKKTTLMQVLKNHGLSLDAPCGGQGKCGKCLVTVENNLLNFDTLKHKKDNNKVLACQLIVDQDLIVTLPTEEKMKASEGLGYSENYLIDSPLKMIKLPLPDKYNAKSLCEIYGFKSYSSNALKSLGKLAGKSAYGLVWDDELLETWPIKPMQTPLLVAIDVGTTGLAVVVLDSITGEVLSKANSLNPQTTIGADVINRISYISDDETKLKQLSKMLVNALGQLIKDSIGKKEKLKDIGAVAISANTTMLHILAGVNPQSLAKAPYRPVFLKSIDLSFLATDLFLEPHTKIFTTPSISAFVGGDVTSGALAIDIKKHTGTILYIDIGTNGEILLKDNNKVFATSCAAGPALEGMNIICGKRAIPGAIDSFTINKNNEFSFTTIDNAIATGICGSGLIDICAELLKIGLIGSDGRFTSVDNSFIPKNISKCLSEGKFYLTDKVYLAQKDIRQVQLAKGAIAAAIELILKKSGKTSKNIDEIIIAGSFGYHLKFKNLRRIGLIPSDYYGKFSFVGNSSLAGAAKILLNNEAFHEIQNFTQNIEVLELGFSKEFQETFIKCLNFIN